MSPEELAEMSQGGRPYTPQQNETVENKPKLVVPKPRNNGEKLYKKCPTCGQFTEVNKNLSSPEPMISSPMNPYIRDYPQDTAKRPASEGRITSDETTEDGQPLVDAKFNDKGISRIPNLPIRGEL